MDDILTFHWSSANELWIRLAMAQIMAKAAKLPASPWPLMMGVVYEAGSTPAIPNRLPCSTAPKAVDAHRTHHCRLSAATPTSQQVDNSQLMMTIFTIVMAKKGSGSRGSLTRTAVTVKTSMMTNRLPITRRRWETLKQAAEDQQSADDTWFWKHELEIDQWCRKKWINARQCPSVLGDSSSVVSEGAVLTVSAAGSWGRWRAAEAA